MDFLQIPVVKREKLGSGHSIRLRQGGKVPVVLYGNKKDTLSLTVETADMVRFLRSGNRLVELKLGEVARTAILRAVQFDPLDDSVLHVDFLRVEKDQEIEDRVPVIFKGRAKGTAEGGVFQAVRDALDVRCRPTDLPKEIVVEVDHLGIHDGIHASDVKLPAGVTLKTPGKALLCTVVTVKAEAAAATPAEGAPAEPEVIGRKEAPGEEGEAAEGADKGDKKPGAEKKAAAPAKDDAKKK